jgi:outer membrane immunogenic protein
MKKILLSAIGAVAMAAPAFAADLPARSYAPPPVVVATVYDWTGFYIGGNGGWASSSNCWGVVPAAGAVIADGCADRSSGVLGGQIGYRWQSNQFVFGLEGQGDWADLTGSHVSIINPAFTTSTRINGIGLFTGQIGYAWNAALLYLKGGAAVTNNSAFINPTLGGAAIASASSSRWGSTVGVGLEYGFSPNWTAGVEYDHLFTGDANNSFSVANPLLAGAANRISQDVDMVTLRLDYKFGGYGAPGHY